MFSWLNSSLPPQFPATESAMRDPNGLLAAGGSLDASWLLEAYRHGIFPWFNPGEPVLWWSPTPRLVLFPDEFVVHRSMRKFLNKKLYTVTLNEQFETVIHHCASAGLRDATWISEPMIRAYCKLHDLGYAQSMECLDESGKLVGGLYGVTLGKVFFGESMFSLADNASKTCLFHLCQDSRYRLIDCQMQTAHLESLGARLIGRREFESLLQQFIDQENTL